MVKYPRFVAAVAELAYALDLGSSVRKDVEVRLLSAAMGWNKGRVRACDML